MISECTNGLTPPDRAHSTNGKHTGLTYAYTFAPVHCSYRSSHKSRTLVDVDPHAECDYN